MSVFFSPAKINLFLRVLRKREDGYHELASLFQTIDLGDILSFELSTKDQLTVNGADLSCDDSNLVVKAIKLFRNKTGISAGFKVHLEKKIPMQAGLGGGSSNAATTLYALNELCGQLATLQMLTDWASELGSDVPFFFSEGTAYCCGRGEVLHPMPQPPSLPIWLVKPPEGVSTVAVYGRTRPEMLPLRDPQMALQSFYCGSAQFFNDLEPAAFQIHPMLEELKKEMQRRGFQHVVLTGSGSGLICVGQGTLPEGMYCRKIHFLNRNPGEWYPAKRIAHERG